MLADPAGGLHGEHVDRGPVVRRAGVGPVQPAPADVAEQVASGPRGHLLHCFVQGGLVISMLGDLHRVIPPLAHLPTLLRFPPIPVHIPLRPTNSAIPPGNFEMLSRLNELDLCGLFKLNNRLGQVVIQLKKSPHKSNSFRRESISKLPGGMALLVGL